MLPDGKIYFMCDSCKTPFIDENPQAVTPDDLEDESISGTHVDAGSFVVYGKLSITGTHNTITLSDTEPRFASHVRNLSITGSHNRAVVQLMPGAHQKVTGSHNKIG
jgi:hypothetical protein